MLLGGECRWFNDGTDARAAFANRKSKVSVSFERLPSIAEAVEWLESWNVPCNRFPQGCVYQDGSLIFTANGVAPTGNYLQFEYETGGVALSFHGEDFLAVEPAAGTPPVGVKRWVSGGCRSFRMNGKPVPVPEET